MTEAEILTKIKTGLMITTPLFDEVLKLHIDEVKFYLRGAGVPETVIDSEESVGVILRGVADLWNNGSGNVKFSPFFYDRASQLALSGGVTNVQTESN